jgi:hypothetical protein
MRRYHRIGLLIGILCLIPVAASAGRFSLSVGYDLKQIDGTVSDADGDFDITAPPAARIELVRDG